MSKYRIHTYPGRLWYVNDFMIPSMLEQGINKADISIYNDEAGDGNLESCMNSFANTIGGKNDFMWYLQDDILISSDFKEKTEQLDNDKDVPEIICAYGFRKRKPPRVQDKKEMWLSMQCVRLPNYIANGCSKWYYEFVQYNTQYRKRVKGKKSDDVILYHYVQQFYSGKILNLIPNLVDHIDTLIGGSVINKQRTSESVSIYWNEPELREKLKDDLRKYNENREH